MSALSLYQRWISPCLPKSCRYYPSCSEYARLSFYHQSFLRSCLDVMLRLLRCNHLFKGGIDYPVVIKTIRPSCTKPQRILFWFVPVSHRFDKFRVVSLRERFFAIQSL